ncbi:FK506-binding protein 4 [Holothuria leucospilota]|uniref:FK506-binding protein 4 n=1 Tax=Holothuria leucospilota TaxID=206669 RepID=A0A9Q1CTR8_HOLLE|nr:FK506-binding protein 4 [Holothuria leucospilota]
MIWGMTLHPGQELTRKVFGEEHLTLASLECRISKYQGKSRPSACLLLKTNMREHVICSLEKGVANQQCLDLIFEEGEKITFAAEGTGIIYLTGYTTKQEEGQNEMLEDQSDGIFLREKEDEEKDNDNNDKMPDNQEDGEILIKLEHDSEDGMQDSDQGGEEKDKEPPTSGNAGSGHDGDMSDHDHCGPVKDDDVDGGIGSSRCNDQGSTSDHGGDRGSDDNTGYHGDNKDNSGDDRDFHGDSIHDNSIQGDGNSCDHVDYREVHLSVAGVPGDGESMYDRDDDKIMDNLDKENQDAHDDEGKVGVSKDRKGSVNHQDGEEDEIIDRLCQEQQEWSVNLASQGIKGGVPRIPGASFEKENWDSASKFDNLKRFNKPVRKSKTGCKKRCIDFNYDRCKCCRKTLSEKRLHQTLRVKCIADPKRELHRKKHSSVSLRCSHFGKAVDYKCRNDNHKMFPLGVK